MIRLYSPEGVQRLRERSRTARALALLTAGLTLAACIALCFVLRTENAGRRQVLVIALSTLGSFTALCLAAEGALPARREADHEAGVLQEAPEERTGTVDRIAPAFRIPKSIAFHAVTLDTAEGQISLKLNARYRKGFPEAGQRIRAEVRRDYVTAWEVIE